MSIFKKIDLILYNSNDFLKIINEEGNKEKYKEFFIKKLKKWNIKSISELDKNDKKKFFKEIEDEWTNDKD